jgi:SAM-dependent methyltransferase
MSTNTTPAWPGETILRLSNGHMSAQAVHAATALGVIDALESGPKTVPEIAHATGAQVGSMHRLLRILLCLGILGESAPATYSLTPAGATLLSSAADSLRSRVLLRFDDASWRAWGELMHSVRTGEPAHPKVTGCDGFTYLGRHPELRATFDAAMSAVTSRVVAGFVDTYDLSTARIVVDVGGGNGRLLADVLRANPHAHGILFDTREGVEHAWATLGELADRCAVAVGDFFDSVPAGADVYLLKSVIHDWPDEQSVRVLRTCRRALAPTSRLLIIELVVPAVVRPGEDLETLCTDLNMLVITGGRERTEGELRALLSSAELEIVSIGPSLGATPYRVIETKRG